MNFITLILAGTGLLQAATLSYQGKFDLDNRVQLFSFVNPTPGMVVLRTFGYAGGTNGAEMLIAPGGFDPVLTLFDSMGNFLLTVNDGACGTVATDPTTKNCFDSWVAPVLAMGSYTVALTRATIWRWGPGYPIPSRK